MTTPPDPLQPVPTTSDPTSPTVPAPVPDGSPTFQDINDLAAAIAKQTMLDFDPATIRKAKVVAVNNAASPPTIDIQFPAANNTDGTAGTPVTVASVRYIDSYSPVVGDTTLILKQNTDIVAVGQINDSAQGTSAQGWTTTSGAAYRMVVDNGDFKVQFKGPFTVSSSTLFTLADSNMFPTAPRNFTAAANNTFGYVRVQVSTSGVVSLIGATTSETTDNPTTGSTGTTSSGSTSFVDPGGITGYAGDVHTHSHGGAVATTSFVETHAHGVNVGHSHTTGAHTHGLSGTHVHTITPALPTTVYFDGCYYFK